MFPLAGPANFIVDQNNIVMYRATTKLVWLPAGGLPTGVAFASGSAALLQGRIAKLLIHQRRMHVREFRPEAIANGNAPIRSAETAFRPRVLRGQAYSHILLTQPADIWRWPYNALNNLRRCEHVRL